MTPVQLCQSLPSRCMAAAVAAVLMLAAPAFAGGKAAASGDGELVLAGTGTREVFWIDTYTLALYLPRDMVSPAAIMDPGVAKDVRIYPVYGGDIPDDMPEAWEEELGAVLSERTMARLRDVYSRMSTGDEVIVRYRPGEGTSLSINGAPMEQIDSHAPMRAMLEMWIGPDPISQDLKEALLAGG